MGVVTELRGARCGWADLLREAPPDLVHARDDGWILARPGEATTGLQLRASGSDLSIRLPFFSGAHELTLAEVLVPQFATASGGRIVVSGQTVPIEAWGRALEQIAPQLVDHSLAEIPKLLASPDVFHVEGWRRPYFLGEITLNQLLRRFPHDELFERLLAAIAAMQAYPDDKVAPVHEVVRDGRPVTRSTWDVATERLIAPCTELVIRHGDASWCVPHARLGDVIPPHGVRLDDLHWLVLRPPADDIAALMRRAEASARR